MNRPQATRCTRKELAYLSHWRREGYMLTIDDVIPLSTCTPPTRGGESVGQWLLGLVIIFAAISMFGLWFAKAAKIY